MSEGLEQEGYEVCVVLNGHEGIERASRETFDAALVDLRMPGVAGMDVVRAVNNTKPETRIIITGYSSIPSAVEAMQLGASDYLPKPVTPNELSDRVRRVLEPFVADEIKAVIRGAVKKTLVFRKADAIAWEKLAEQFD